MTAAAQLTVIKVGGSLHDEARLFQRLEALCESLSPDRILIVSGGGAAADAVRDWDRHLSIGESASHDLAIHAMGLGARLLVHGVPNSTLVSTVADSHLAWEQNEIAVADPHPFIDSLAATSDTTLPIGWHCTADSIAVWIAKSLAAHRVVLCKSISLQEATAASIDQHLAKMLDLPKLFWCNLRDERPSLHAFTSIV